MTDLKATIQLIKDNTDLRQIIPDLKKVGSAYMRLCPFHSDKNTPSLQVNEKYYWCHSCNSHGDLLTWLQHYNNTDFTSALALAAIEAGVSLSDDLYERMAVVQKERDERAEELWKYREAYKSSEKAQKYLKEERGLSDETIEHFQLAYRPDYDAVVIPLFARNGNLVALSYRFLSNGQQRYMHKNTSEWQKGNELYNSQCLDFNEGPVVITEGPFDAMSVWQSGFKKSISILGGSITDQHVKELTGQSLIFIPDRKSENDFQLFRKSVFRLRQAHPELSIKVALLPEGDASSSGEQAICDAISNCQVAEFAILQHDLDQCAEVDQEYRTARTICADIKDVLVLDGIIKYLSNRWSIDRSVVKEALDRSERPQIKIKTVSEAIAELEENERTATIDGLCFPWNGISKHVKRPHSKQICIFAGRAGVGKTMFSLNMLHQSRKYEIPTLFLSMEQPNSELLHRLAIMTASELDLLNKRELHDMIVSADENWDAIKAVLEFGFPNVRFCDFRLDINGISDAIIDSSYSMGMATKIVYIDYLGLIKSLNKGSSYERVSEVARDLQEMTKQRDVYSIILSQLNREAGDGSQAVLLHHLRDAGTVEEVADLVIAAWKPNDSDAAEDLGIKKMHIEILKHRHGTMGGCDLWLDQSSLLLTEADYYHSEY